MDLHKTEKSVLMVVANIMHINVSEIHMEDSLANHLTVDSLDFVEIIMSLKDEFTIRIPDSDYEKFKTVQNLVDYVKEKR